MLPMVGRSVGTPCQSATPAKTTTVSRKLAKGPASTVSMRRPTLAPWKLAARSAGDMRASVRGSARLEPSLSPRNFT